MQRWQCPTETYNGRLGIRARVPSFFEKIDGCCPKWTTDEIKNIQNNISGKKVIPTLLYVPNDLHYFTKQLWWLVPFVIWKEDTASWVFIDKNGIHALHPDDEDGPVIFSWDKVGSFDMEWPEDNLCILTVYSNDSDMYLTFSEFVSEGCGSYLSIILVYMIFLNRLLKPAGVRIRGNTVPVEKVIKGLKLIRNCWMKPCGIRPHVRIRAFLSR